MRKNVNINNVGKHDHQDNVTISLSRCSQMTMVVVLIQLSWDYTATLLELSELITYIASTSPQIPILHLGEMRQCGSCQRILRKCAHLATRTYRGLNPGLRRDRQAP